MLKSSIIYIWPGSYEVSGSAAQQPQILQNVVVSVSTKRLISKILPVLLLINLLNRFIPGLFLIEVIAWRCSVQKVFLKISQNLQENNRAKTSFSIKLQACLQLYCKEILAQVFSWKRCEIFQNTFLYRTSPAAVSVLTPKKHVFGGYRKKPLRSSHQRCFIKKVFLKTSQNSQENTCARVSFY